MKLYSVIWMYDKDLSKGKGRCVECVTGFTVLCNNAQEALSCLPYHWHTYYKSRDVFDIEDGEVKLTRCKIDSRNFNANYIFLDKMREPLELSSIDKSLFNYSRFFKI